MQPNMAPGPAVPQHRSLSPLPAALPGARSGFRANLAEKGCAIRMTRPPPALFRKLRSLSGRMTNMIGV